MTLTLQFQVHGSMRTGEVLVSDGRLCLVWPSGQHPATSLHPLASPLFDQPPSTTSWKTGGKPDNTEVG